MPTSTLTLQTGDAQRLDIAADDDVAAPGQTLTIYNGNEAVTIWAGSDPDVSVGNGIPIPPGGVGEVHLPAGSHYFGAVSASCAGVVVDQVGP